MNLIGNKNLFAYQWELIDHENTYYWGNFCFWIAGKEIGDYEEVTTLSGMLSYLKEFMKNGDKRFYFRSDRVSKDELFYEIHDKFFDRGYKGDSSESFGYFKDTFWLDDIGWESTRDKIAIILLDEFYADRQRFIWKYHDTGKIEEASIPYAHFQWVSQQFIAVLSAEIESLGE